MTPNPKSQRLDPAPSSVNSSPASPSGVNAPAAATTLNIAEVPVYCCAWGRHEDMNHYGSVLAYYPPDRYPFDFCPSCDLGHPLLEFILNEMRHHVIHMGRAWRIRYCNKCLAFGCKGM